jgi:cytochrome P450
MLAVDQEEERRMRRRLDGQLPPGPSVPAALQMLGTWTRPATSLERLRKYGKRATVQLPFQPPLVLLWDPDEIKELFTAPADVIHPGEGARVLEPIVGRSSVILLDETAHMEQRRLMLPAFHGERMRVLTGLMTELSEHEVESWPVGGPVALHPRLQRLTLEVILRAVFGLDRGPRLDRLRDHLTSLLEFGESPLSVMPVMQRLLSWSPTQRRFEALKRETDELIAELVSERREEAAGQEATAPERSDILAVLLAARHEDDSEMSFQEIRDELITALVAGHETTASQLAWALERLSREPRATARLTEELDSGESDEYLTATINEILRLRPVIPNAEPRLTKRPVEIGGFRYPAGVLLLASAQLLHHDPEIYDRPFEFRPERFLEKPPGTYTWIPFGGGRRRCLGASFAVQEMKIALRVVLTRYRLSPAGERPEGTRRRGITFSPDRQATVVLRPRQDVAAQAPPAFAAA